MGWERASIKPTPILGTSDGVVRIIQISDPHIGNTTPDPGLAGFKNAIAASRIIRPQVFVCTGDFTPYGEFNYLQQAFRLADNSMAQVNIMTIGNHDLEEVTLGRGNVNLATPTNEGCYNSDVFYFSRTVAAGDGSWSALCLSLDQNYKATAEPPYYEQYDQFGVYYEVGNDPTYGGFDYNPAQLTWIESELAASDADVVFLFCHIQPSNLENGQVIADILKADGRPAVFFFGHNHGNTRMVDLAPSTGGTPYTCYKPPGVMESGCYTLFSFSFSGGSLALESAIIHDYTPVDGWTISAPFTLAE